MDMVEIIGTVVGVKDATNGTFFLVRTETGGYEKLYDFLWQYEFIGVGTVGTFLVDGLPRWNPCRKLGSNPSHCQIRRRIGR